jgi:hypothetical protein
MSRPVRGLSVAGPRSEAGLQVGIQLIEPRLIGMQDLLERVFRRLKDRQVNADAAADRDLRRSRRAAVLAVPPPARGLRCT